MKIRFGLFFLLGLFFVAVHSKGAEENISEEGPYVTTPFLILKSTKNYPEALTLANDAAQKLQVKLDLRDLTPNDEVGLTFPSHVCEENGWRYPCYVARGRYDNGVYVSIEYSTPYQGFSKGYYIVIAASGNKEVKKTIKRAKANYPDAYSKSTKVYIGCMD